MYFFDSEKLQSEQKATFDLLEQVNGKVLKGVEQLTQLQLAAIRAASEEGLSNVRKLFSARDPQSFSAAFGSFATPAHQAERLMEFNRKVYDVVSSTQADIAKLAESQAAKNTQQMQDLVSEIAKNAPAGTESAVAMMKSAVEGAGSVYESAQRTAKQAAEIAENGLAAAASAASQASQEAGKAAGGARK
jgi:phasin family protein